MVGFKYMYCRLVFCFVVKFIKQIYSVAELLSFGLMHFTCKRDIWNKLVLLDALSLRRKREVTVITHYYLHTGPEQNQGKAIC